MPNLYKTVMLLLIAGVSLGAVSMFHPEDPGIPRERARVVGPLYAVPVERVETHVLGSGETLSQLFAQASIAGREFADMLMALREYQSPRRLSVGTEITIRRWIETDEPRAVDIRINADSTIRLARGEVGWQGSVRLTPVELDTVYVAGVIEQGRTLYEAIVRDETSNLPPGERIQLVSELLAEMGFRDDLPILVVLGREGADPEAVTTFLAAMQEAIQLMREDSDDGIWQSILDHELYSLPDPSVFPAVRARWEAGIPEEWNQDMIDGLVELVDQLVAVAGSDVVGVESLDADAFTTEYNPE